MPSLCPGGTLNCLSLPVLPPGPSNVPQLSLRAQVRDPEGAQSRTQTQKLCNQVISLHLLPTKCHSLTRVPFLLWYFCLRGLSRPVSSSSGALAISHRTAGGLQPRPGGEAGDPSIPAKRPRSQLSSFLSPPVSDPCRLPPQKPRAFGRTEQRTCKPTDQWHKAHPGPKTFMQGQQTETHTKKLGPEVATQPRLVDMVITAPIL